MIPWWCLLTFAIGACVFCLNVIARSDNWWQQRCESKTRRAFELGRHCADCKVDTSHCATVHNALAPLPDLEVCDPDSCQRVLDALARARKERYLRDFYARHAVEDLKRVVRTQPMGHGWELFFGENLGAAVNKRVSRAYAIGYRRGRRSILRPGPIPPHIVQELDRLAAEHRAMPAEGWRRKPTHLESAFETISYLDEAPTSMTQEQYDAIARRVARDKRPVQPREDATPRPPVPKPGHVA